MFFKTKKIKLGYKTQGWTIVESMEVHGKTLLSFYLGSSVSKVCSGVGALFRQNKVSNKFKSFGEIGSESTRKRLVSVYITQLSNQDLRFNVDYELFANEIIWETRVIESWFWREDEKLN